MKKVTSLFAAMVSVGVAVSVVSTAAAPNLDLWPLASKEGRNHRFSTLFTAHDVRQYLSSQAGLDNAVDWCKRAGVTKVYVEVFRDGYQADPEVLKNAA